MFYHGYDNYINHALPFDELKPLSCTGVNNFGGLSLTMVDALDALVILGNYTEFEKRVWWIVDNVNFDKDVNISVFETNIRVLGGLLSSHLMITDSGLPLMKGERKYAGELLHMAKDLGNRLMPAFKTSTQIPYGTVNLRHGVPPMETPVTCTACGGTFILEFGALSVLTGNVSYLQAANAAIMALWAKRSAHGLYGNHIDTSTGDWYAKGASIGGGIDSFYEYLLKGSILFDVAYYEKLFKNSYESIIKVTKINNWYIEVDLDTPTSYHGLGFSALQGFWPGLQSMHGDLLDAAKTMVEFHYLWRKYGVTPEFYAMLSDDPGFSGYPLRPEMAESLYYLSTAMPDELWFEFGKDMVQNLNTITRVDCGFAAVQNVKKLELRDTMDSFFLSELAKYLYLLFDDDNHFRQQRYIWNTEGHPFPMTKNFFRVGHTMDSIDFYKVPEARQAQCPKYNNGPYFDIKHRLLEEHCSSLGLLGNISIFCKSHNIFAPPKPEEQPKAPPPPYQFTPEATSNLDVEEEEPVEEPIF